MRAGILCFPTSSRVRSLHGLHPVGGFAYQPAISMLPSSSIGWVQTILLCHSFTPKAGTGISTRCPSTTLFSLILGPGLPRADEPSPGNLRQSVCGILTHISLLTPAFSLVCAPALLPINLQCTYNAPLPLKYLYNIQIHSFGILLSPGKSSAQGHSTSELLRTLSRVAASKPTS